MIIAIIGINGKMGSRVYEFYKNKYTIIGIDSYQKNDVAYYNSLKDFDEKVDLVIDFSDASAFDELAYALNNNIKVISGTTNYTDEQITKLSNIKTGLFYHSVNFAKGINLFKELIKKCNESYSLIDFIEVHQKTKKDAPSGTSRMLAKEIAFDPNNIQSIRLNNASALHELIFTSGNERIIVAHEVIGPSVFIDGLDMIVKKMINK